MKRFLTSPFDRAMFLMFIGNVLFLIWLRPDIQRALATARSSDSPRWAVVLLVLGLASLLFAELETLINDPLDDEFSTRRF